MSSGASTNPANATPRAPLPHPPAVSPSSHSGAVPSPTASHSSGPRPHSPHFAALRPVASRRCHFRKTEAAFLRLRGNASTRRRRPGRVESLARRSSRALSRWRSRALAAALSRWKLAALGRRHRADVAALHGQLSAARRKAVAAQAALREATEATRTETQVPALASAVHSGPARSHATLVADAAGPPPPQPLLPPTTDAAVAAAAAVAATAAAAAATAAAATRSATTALPPFAAPPAISAQPPQPPPQPPPLPPPLPPPPSTLVASQHEGPSGAAAVRPHAAVGPPLLSNSESARGRQPSTLTGFALAKDVLQSAIDDTMLPVTPPVTPQLRLAAAPLSPSVRAALRLGLFDGPRSPVAGWERRQRGAGAGVHVRALSSVPGAVPSRTGVRSGGPGHPVAGAARAGEPLPLPGRPRPRPKPNMQILRGELPSSGAVFASSWASGTAAERAAEAERRVAADISGEAARRRRGGGLGGGARRVSAPETRLPGPSGARSGGRISGR